MPDLGADPLRDRLRVVEQARRIWRGRLIDLSRRNNLLYFRDLKTGTLDLSAVSPERLAPLFRVARNGDEPTVPFGRLFNDDNARIATARAQEIRRRATVNLEERGLDTLHLVLGFATWRPDDDGRPPQAPVLLMPVRIEAAGRDGRLLGLRRAGDLVPNLVLLHALQHTFDTGLSHADIADDLDGDEEDEVFDPGMVFDRIREGARDVPGFDIAPGMALGNFAFQKLAMVEELDRLGDELAGHDLIAAIAGVQPAREQFLTSRSDVPGEHLDTITADQEHLVLDADSSQQRAVRSACAGRSGIISGPPGTGKSQTIVNLVAELAASGKRVLFVAEKRAALDVVLNRLSRLGLEHLCLDLHGAEVKRRDVAERVGDTLAAVRRTTRVDPNAQHRDFERRRAQLNEHVRLLHLKHLPWDVSLYELQSAILATPPGARSGIRWRRDRGLLRLDRATVARAEDLLLQLRSVADLFRGTSDSPWATAEIESVEEATRAVDLARELNDTLWPALMEAVRSVAIEIGPAAIVSITDAGNVLLLLGNVDRLLEAYAGGLFDDEVEAHAEALGPARRRLTRVWARVTNPRYGRALRWVRSLRRHGPASTAGLLEDARRAVDLRARWRELRLDGRPRTCPSEAALASAHERAATPLSRLAKVLCRADVPTLPLADVQSLLDRLVTDAHTAVRVARWRQLEKALLELAGPTFVRELRTMDVDPARWPEVFRYAWQRSCLEAIHVEHPAFATFDGRTHHQFVEEFRGLDKARIELAVHRVRARHAERVVDMCNRFRDQESLVRQEAAKKRRHLPVRELVARAPDVLTALFPCWLASPLSVSQLLPARHLFDVVLFDEASQVLPEDAVPALYRAVQAVVAGDRRQLPPTTFFAALDEGGESEDEAVSGFESILDNLSTFLAPEWHLDWHYRSRDEALIAFSNHHIYRNRLVTFPGPGREPAIGHELVHHAGADGEEESAGPEVRRVVELVSEHAEQRPGESLGVIAMGITHAVRIEAAVDRLRQERPELAEFFDEEKPERFFVKNLERVQGDERDAIVLSVGYGKDRAGRLPYRFGPLLQEGGERRLNVAITRARRRMTVVSSFSHLDMDPGRSTKEGVRLLRGFLEFAASGGRNLGRDDATGEPLNLFEQQVATALEARGISLVPQYGVSRFRLDLAAQHPRKPGRLVLAIECDGATYHSAPTARDRDRLRQQHLEALGWRFHRIWSTDWFLNPEQETVRALQAYEDAVAFADRVDGGGPVAPEPPGPVIPTPMTEAPRTLGFRPAVVPGLAIDDYLDRDLVSLALWLLQRHTLATDSELLPLMMNELGFQRRGAKIVERLEAAIRAARRLATSQK